MSESEDDVINRKKQRQALIDSDREASDGHTSNNDIDHPSSSNSLLLNNEKVEQVSSGFCDSDIGNNPSSQNLHRSPPSHFFESDEGSRNSINEHGRNLNLVDSDSNFKSENGHSMYVNDESSLFQSNKPLSADSEFHFPSNSSTFNHRGIESSSESGCKTVHISSCFDESINQPVFEEKFDSILDSENSVKLKLKKFKLLSDDDFSEEEGNHCVSNNKNSGCESNDNIQILSSAKRSKLKKQKRKEKLQLLNELKRKEIAEKSGSVSADSNSESENCENSCTPRKKKIDNSRVSLHGTASSDSEKDFKSRGKSHHKVKPERKSKKSDPKLEIKSRTQKMIRENRISLPYHQPKKRSLNEFLERRKSIPSIPLKASIDVLRGVSEDLSKHEKEVAIFYQSESDQSDNDFGDSAIKAPPDLQIKTDVSIETFVSVDDDVSAAKISETENNVDLCKENERYTALRTFDVDQKDTELLSGALETSSPKLDVSLEKVGEESPEIMNAQKVSDDDNKGANSDNFPPEINRLNPAENEDDVAQFVDTLIENLESDLESHAIVIKETSEQNSDRIKEDTAEIKNSFEESVPQQPKQSRIAPLDSDDFDLIIQNSHNDAEMTTGIADQVTPGPVVDLRTKKLASLSRLNIPVLDHIKLQASPDIVIEFDSPTTSESGVLELKKKFVLHSVARKKTPRKSSTKLSTIRTEKNSQGDIINVIKETINVSCGEVTKDKEETEEILAPGAKHLNFKERMLKTLVAKKTEKWQAYQTEKRKLYDTHLLDDEEYDDEDYEKPDFEPYHPEDELNDDELEEDDVEIKDKKSKKSDYVDDEAEVSFDEDENVKDSEDEDDEIENEVKANSSDDDALDENKDGDVEILNSEKKNSANWSQLSHASTDTFKKPLLQVGPLFKYNTTGTELENKVLGLESIFGRKSQAADEVTNSQLIDMCSGKFSSQMERLNSSNPSDSEFFFDSQHAEDSQNINLSLQDTNDGFNVSEPCVQENKNFLVLSDESDTEELFARRKKLMQLEDSDDDVDAEAPADDPASSENENDEKEPDNDEDADELEAVIDDDEELAYNSEEEIITKEKAAEFFDNEAELSESEWGSEDENEQNLDVLEKEAGDDDMLDENELKEELGKIHMRKLLDDDQQDVRLLKEMLLEDGELHSDGKRQRKFQWTNLDDNGFFSKVADDSDEDVLNEDEEETDANWRKIRHEREMFISQQEKKDDLMEEAENETSDSLPLSTTSISKIIVNNTKSNMILNQNMLSPDSKFPLKAQLKCGSFLTRSKILLNRLAASVGECKENVTGRAKNHRNFVFAALSPERKELPDVPEMKIEKRKISSKSVIACKKLKLAASGNQCGLLAQLTLNE